MIDNVFKPCQDNNTLKVISLKQTLKNLKNDWLKKNPKASPVQAYQATKQNANLEYDKKIKAALNNSKSMERDAVLFLDKSYLSAEVDGLIEELDNHSVNNSTTLKKIALVPKIKEPF